MNSMDSKSSADNISRTNTVSSQAVVALLVTERTRILEVTGPASVFSAANEALGQPHYMLRIVSAGGGLVHSVCAAALDTAALATLAPESIDTLLVAGGDWPALRESPAFPAVDGWIRRAARTVRRLGAVGSGSLLLASCGLVEGRHVAARPEIAAHLLRHRSVQVDTDALYAEDRGLWTSAGMTAGIDMSLALVERDLGSAIAQRVAEALGLYVRRPGHQSQHSPLLDAQARADQTFTRLLEWINENIGKEIDVAMLADRVAMTERTFHRKFTARLGQTPARFIETLRLDRAKALLGSVERFKDIAHQAGFSNQAQLSRAFERRFGMSLLAFSQTHRLGRSARQVCYPAFAQAQNGAIFRNAERALNAA